ncbi:MAG: FkbM family methyltransferase [Rhodoplanes sp.]
MTDYGSRAAAAFNCPPTMAWHVNKVLNGEYDIQYEHPNPVILDIGANVGAFAIWASRRWPGSHIHCYEPLPENFALLRQNLAPLAGRVELNDCAIGDPAHTLLFLGRNNCGEASFFDIGEQRSEAVQVTTKPPSVLPRADILKMDVEGAEIEIMSGLARIEFDAVLLEYHSETNRRMVDQLLDQYVLVGGDIRTIDRGVLKYFHRRLLGRAAG